MSMTAQFACVPLWTLRVPLSGRARIVYLAIAGHANKAAIAWPSLQRIAQVTGIASRKISALINELVNARMIRKEAGARRGRATVYRVCRESPERIEGAEKTDGFTPVDGDETADRFTPVDGPLSPLPGCIESPPRGTQQTRTYQRTYNHRTRLRLGAETPADDESACTSNFSDPDSAQAASTEEPDYFTLEALPETVERGQPKKTSPPPLSPSSQGAGFVVNLVWQEAIQCRHGPFGSLAAAQADIAEVLRGGFPTHPESAWRIELRDPTGVVVEHPAVVAARRAAT